MLLYLELFEDLSELKVWELLRIFVGLLSGICGEFLWGTSLVEDILGKKLGKFTPCLQVFEVYCNCMDSGRIDASGTVVGKGCTIKMLIEKVIGTLDSGENEPLIM